ncbi:MAG: 50S ribosomal protein L1 [Bacteroidetes bacterium]|nr:50S ribosomal protein L1 [Bacteroidota bacterium]NCQ11862.1 50S ribosomal protein L1 [Bacteroidota bacterium]
MSKKGKKYSAVVDPIEQNKAYTLAEAAELVVKTSTTKFDSSVDIDVRLGVDPRHADQMVRGTVSLPHGTGKTVRVLALVNPSKQEDAVNAGADFVGLDDKIAEIEGGWLDFDVIVATPDVMGKLGKLGRVLGPRGLMPNPKSGTVTMEVGNAIREVKAGKIDFRVDKYGILHAAIAKASFDAQNVKENAEAFLQTVVKLKPSSAKGIYIRSIYLSTTMGPSIQVDRSAAQ